MTRKFALLAAAFMLPLAFVSGAGTPAVAQDATPEAVAAPQTLLPATWDEAQGQTAKINGVDI
jgi:hypothetical protein